MNSPDGRLQNLGLGAEKRKSKPEASRNLFTISDASCECLGVNLNRDHNVVHSAFRSVRLGRLDGRPVASIDSQLSCRRRRLTLSGGEPPAWRATGASATTCRADPFLAQASAMPREALATAMQRRATTSNSPGPKTSTLAHLTTPCLLMTARQQFEPPARRRFCVLRARVGPQFLHPRALNLVERRRYAPST